MELRDERRRIEMSQYLHNFYVVSQKDFFIKLKQIGSIALSLLSTYLPGFAISSLSSIRRSTEQEKNHDIHKRVYRSSLNSLVSLLLRNYDSKCSENQQHSSETTELEDDLNLSLNLCYSCSSIASQFLCAFNSSKRQWDDRKKQIN